MRNLIFMAILRFFLGMLIIGAPLFAFGNSGGGRWLGELVSRGVLPPEPTTLLIAVGLMLGTLILKRNAAPLPSAVWPAAVGTLLHLPGMLSESAISWGRYLPGDVSARLTDTTVNEPVIAVTMLVLLVASMVRYVLNISDEERRDLLGRGLSQDVSGNVVSQTTRLELLTLGGGITVGIVTFAIVQIVGSTGGIAIGGIPTTLLGFAGILLSITGVFLFFIERNRPDLSLERPDEAGNSD